MQERLCFLLFPVQFGANFYATSADKPTCMGATHLWYRGIDNFHGLVIFMNHVLPNGRRESPNVERRLLGLCVVRRRGAGRQQLVAAICLGGSAKPLPKGSVAVTFLCPVISVLAKEGIACVATILSSLSVPGDIQALIGSEEGPTSFPR